MDWAFMGFVVEGQVGRGEFEIQKVGSASEVQWPGLRHRALSLLEDVVDVLAGEGSELLKSRRRK